MKPRKNSACFILCLVLAFNGLFAQDLRKDEAFFRKKLPEFRLWLKENNLDKVFRADSISVRSQKVTLFLCPSFTGQRVCDSLQCVWNKLEAENRDLNGQFFHDRLLRKWAFLAEIKEEQAEVVVRCHNPAHFFARIYGQDGKIPIESRTIRSSSLVEMYLPPGSVEGVNTGDNVILLRGKKVVPVCTAAKKFFVNWYKDKGTPILFNAKIDTAYSFEDEFVVEVTKLSYEICPDGFFEYHRISVKGTQKGDDVELKWEFQGKYGSGILFPPRKNDYKDMELRYKNELEAYQRNVFRHLTNYLRR